jgi:hypothetical protein
MAEYLIIFILHSFIVGDSFELYCSLVFMSERGVQEEKSSFSWLLVKKNEKLFFLRVCVWCVM